MPQHKERGSPERFTVYRLGRADERPSAASFAEDVRRGLTQQPKQLPPKYFYDEIGSHLFDVICLLPEYYLTRAENEILARHAADIVARAARPDERLALIELGSGSAQKTRLVIEALLGRQGELLYVPVDISATALETSSRLLLESYPPLTVRAYAGDYFSALAEMSGRGEASGRKLVLFLGSNIGNFDYPEALDFLHTLRRLLSPGDSLLLGADLKKDPAVLEAAYDDALGVTAAFNLNLLARINRELDADFDLRSFKHVAFYRAEAGRIEIYLESLRAQSVHLGELNLAISFAAGERIHTENSHKYDLGQLSELASRAGFARTFTWYDRTERFSSNLFVAVGE